MKISYNWLKTLINTDIPVEEAAALLTASGLEVEGIEKAETIKGGLTGLVVGEVLECKKHPDADRLSLTTVSVGAENNLSIVCGAPNVSAGQKVIVAAIGTKLYPSTGEPFEIKKSKIRGALSEGMICAEDEIGLGNSHDGIMVLPVSTPTGMPASEYFKIENDNILEIGLTPNRNDAASHLGVARDLAAVLNSKNGSTDLKASLPEMQSLPEATNTVKVDINIQNHDACKRYSGIVIGGITVKESPDWLKNRLQSIGLRPINNIVDITNFILHESGQPLHAFDLEKIKGNKIVVRLASEGEKFKTLDAVERTLKTNDLVICDEKDAMCIAGIFGGSESGVTEKTTSVFLESAYFNPDFIRRTAKHHGLKTDASFRFERGTDPEMTVKALERAATLVLELAGGVVSMPLKDVYTEPLEPHKIGFSFSNCTDLIGKEIDRGTIRSIIVNLGIDIEMEGNDGLLLKVPRYKADVTREADVIEEVMRVYGYNNIEVSKAISYTAFNAAKNYDVILEDKIAALFSAQGFNEIMCLSLTKESYYPENSNLVKVVNPLSNELNVLRGDMINSGLEAIAYNKNRKSAGLKLYEIGRTYQALPDHQYAEKKHLAIYVTGALFKENPYGINNTADLSFLRAIVEGLFDNCGIKKYQGSDSSNSNFEYGLNLQLKNKTLAEIGSIKKSVLKTFGLSDPVFYAVIDWDNLAGLYSKQKIEYEEVSKFPSVRRDLALLIDRKIKYDEIRQLAYATEKNFLQDVNLFDVYEGEKLGNKKSYAVSFTLLNKEATLTDKQIDNVMEKLIAGYKNKLGAELR